MEAREALRSGDVRQALDLLKAEVRRAPREARLRTFLFQLFCITGEWERALTQLRLAADLDPLATPMVQTYEVLIRCELLRGRVFSGKRSATVLGDPGGWLPLLMEATRLLALGERERALRLREAAFEAAPATPAVVDGTVVEWLADADPRLGPVLEAVVEGKYVWVPYERIASITIEPPADLRDQVWTPASFVWANQGRAVGFIPARYPATTDQSDPALLLGRRTEWIGEGEWALPVGQRMLVSPAAETALLDLRRLELLAPAAADPAALATDAATG